MEAEKELVQAFQRWLGEGEVRTIQQHIQDEFVRTTQFASESDQESGGQPGVDIYLACDSDEMARLPWEAWPLAPEFVSPGAVRIVRTAMNEPEGHHPPKSSNRRGKARILAILGDDPRLPLQEDWKAVRSLKAIAKVQRFTWQPEDTVAAIKQKFAAAICDDQGWDVLFFAGHSDETTVTGGRIAIAPHIYLSISEIEDHLTQARENGLQLAIFNSCSGLSIANSLVDLGLQVAVMREPIRNDVAQSFLQPLCQQLAQHTDIHTAILTASQRLQSAEKFAYPSAHLIPSFFSPSGIAPYRIALVGWKRRLRKCIPTRKWLPTKLEAATLGILLVVSSLGSVQISLLNWRTLAQAGYRDLTNQLPSNAFPSVLILAIDQESINQENHNRSNTNLDPMKIWPMDRAYLAKLIKKLSALEARVIGIDYFLNTGQPNEAELTQAIQTSIEKNSAWYVFVDSEVDDKDLRLRVANRNWSLRGHSGFYEWDVELPVDPTCDLLCPFAYMLTTAKILSRQSNAPQPVLHSQADFQTDISNYLRNKKEIKQNPKINDLMTQSNLPFWMGSVIDFSIPPKLTYQSIPAHKFLNTQPFSTLEEQIVIIASDGYEEAEDKFPIPPAIDYWRRSNRRKADTPKEHRQFFTGGEAHAYMINQLISSHRVVQIDTWAIIFLAALLGKGMTLAKLQRSNKQQYNLALSFISLTIAYAFFGLQIYISASVLIPWLLPSIIFWTYAIKTLKKRV